MSTALPQHLQKLTHEPHWDVGPGWDVGRVTGFWALAKDAGAECPTQSALCSSSPTAVLALMSSAPFSQGQTSIL